jgi:hypothetical protein
MKRWTNVQWSAVFNRVIIVALGTALVAVFFIWIAWL